MSRTLLAEITAIRRRNHERRGPLSLENQPPSSREWPLTIGRAYGTVCASLSGMSEVDDDDEYTNEADPRAAVLGLIADAMAWVETMDTDQPLTGIHPRSLDSSWKR